MDQGELLGVIALATGHTASPVEEDSPTVRGGGQIWCQEQPPGMAKPSSSHRKPELDTDSVLSYDLCDRHQCAASSLQI